MVTGAAAVYVFSPSPSSSPPPRTVSRPLASSRNALMSSEDCSLILFIFYNQRLHGAGKVHPHRQLRHKRHPAATLPPPTHSSLSPHPLTFPGLSPILNSPNLVRRDRRLPPPQAGRKERFLVSAATNALQVHPVDVVTYWRKQRPDVRETQAALLEPGSVVPPFLLPMR